MRTLLAKEARQVLLAHAFLGVLILAVLLWLLPGGRLLLPQAEFEEGAVLAVLFVILEGLLIGLFTFGYEHWSRTEAYLLHRGITAGQAFLAKLITGLTALAVVSAAPVLAYYALHAHVLSSVEGGSFQATRNLLAVCAVGVPAYAVGVFCARLRVAWASRVLLALLAATSVLTYAVMTARPWGAELAPSPLRFAALQLGGGALALLLAWRMFLAGDDEGHPWPARLGTLVTLASVVLIFTPYGVGLRVWEKSARKALFESYPSLVARADGELLLVRKEGLEYVALDGEERPLGGDELADYNGRGFDLDPFLNVFWPAVTHLEHDAPHDDVLRGRGGRQPFEFQGQLIDLSRWTQSLGLWFQPEEGLLTAQELDEGRRRLVRLGRGQERERFSPRTVVTFLRDTLPAFDSAVLVDLDHGSVWRPRRDGTHHRVERYTLPGDDRVIGVERVHSFFGAYVGLYEPFDTSDGLILVGEKDRYLLTSEGAVAEADAQAFAGLLGRGVPESEVAGTAALRLEPKGIDGLAFTLDVRDAESGALLLTHAYRPRTLRQRVHAGLALTASALLPPLGAVRAFFLGSAPEREVCPASLLWRDPLLLGGRRPWLLVVNLLLAAALAWHTHRRLERGARGTSAARTWSLCVLAFGLPAYFIAMALEPTPRAAPRASRAPLPEPALLIRSA